MLATQSGITRTIDIDFLFIDLTTCTRCRGTDENLGRALESVRSVLAATGANVKVRRILIDSEEIARAHRFVSSPTIRVNGRDVALTVKESRCGSCGDAAGQVTDCRVWTYEGTDYTEAPEPLLVDAILRAAYAPAGAATEPGSYSGVRSQVVEGRWPLLPGLRRHGMLHARDRARTSVEGGGLRMCDGVVTTEQVFSEFGGRLRAFIARRVRDPEDADDLLQEIFLRMHRAGATVSDVERLPTWLFQVTRNALVDHYRAAAARHRNEAAALEERADDMKAVSPVDGARDEEELASCLAPLLQRVPEPYREAVRLTSFSGVPQNTAAKRLGLSVSGMKSRVQRGRRLLRDEVLRCCTVEFDRRGGVARARPRGAGSCGGEGGCAS